jgi:tripartite-type tricarboxylate transporter receptor subunit TctC
MNIRRRHLLALAAALPAAAATARAQEAGPPGWVPERPPRLIAGFAPGGSADLVARLAAVELAKLLGRQVVVDNRSGASGNIATQAVVQAEPDGHTLGFAGLQLATNPALIASLGYDPERDLQMVGQLTALPVLVVASASSGIRTLPELVERSKAQEEGVLVGAGGYGTSSHLGPEMLFRAVGGRYTPVLYRGGAPAFQSVLAGDVEVMFDIVAGYHAPAAKDGRIRLLAVLQDKREPALPEVPAISEFGLGPEAQMRSWQGIYVRAGTPAPILAALHRAVVATVEAPEVQRRFREVGMDPVASPSPEAFQRLYLSELARWSGLIREAGITAQ